MNIFTNDEVLKIIEMYKNNINIEDIIREFDCEEKYIRRVLKDNKLDRKYNSFTKELYDRMVNLYKFGCSQKHICEQLLLRSGSCIRKELLKRGERIRTNSENNRIYSLDEHYFDIIDTQNKAYILGLLYADGCNHTGHNSITLSLQESDYSVVEFVKNELKYGGPIRKNNLSSKNSRYQNQCILCINSEYMSKSLEKLGVVNAKSLVLTFPDFLPDHLISHFCRGYFDGDGCIYYDEKRSKCQTQTVGTRDICDKLSNILYSFECKNSIKHPKQCGNNNTFILETCGNKSSLKFLSWMYKDANFYMDRKYQKYLYFREKYLNTKMVA